jgi:hypothetical protein
MSAIGVEAHIDQLLLTNLNLCPRGAKINFYDVEVRNGRLRPILLNIENLMRHG